MRAIVAQAFLICAALATCGAAAAAIAPRKAIRPTDQARAKKVLLALGDFPPGWKVQPGSKDNSSPTVAPGCAKISLSDLTETADTEREFGQEPLGIPVVDSAVGMLRTRAQADKLWQRVPTESNLSCAARNGAGLPKGSHVSFRKLALPRIGDRSVGWQFTVKTAALPSFTADIVFANKGRTFSVLSVASLGSSVDGKLERSLARAMATRLERYAE
jgi:hypothetical protein